MVAITKRIPDLTSGLLIVTFSIQVAHGEVCPANTKQNIQSDLVATQGQLIVILGVRG